MKKPCIASPILIGSLLMTLAFGLVPKRALADLPPCNGETPSGTKRCGEQRSCPTGQPCTGTAVIRSEVTKECIGGSANELCDNQSQTCTETFHCKSEFGGAICGADLDNPALDDDDEPIISTADVPTAKSCST